MIIGTIIVDMEEGEEVAASLLPTSKTLCIDFGDELSVFISPEKQPIHYARFCKFFGLVPDNLQSAAKAKAETP